jgi:hypothetical protein
MMIKNLLIVNHCNFEGGMKYVFEKVPDERTTFDDCNFFFVDDA